MKLSELIERLKHYDPDCIVSLRTNGKAPLETCALTDLKTEMRAHLYGGHDSGHRRHLVLIGTLDGI
jgi:hypothetical protein